MTATDYLSEQAVKFKAGTLAELRTADAAVVIFDKATIDIARNILDMLESRIENQTVRSKLGLGTDS